jgi:hypothetical protein
MIIESGQQLWLKNNVDFNKLCHYFINYKKLTTHQDVALLNNRTNYIPSFHIRNVASYCNIWWVHGGKSKGRK